MANCDLLPGRGPSTSTLQESSQKAGDFERRAAEEEVGLLREFWDFLRYNKKWWLTPIIVALLLVGALIILGGTAAAPFIYTLF